MAPYTNKVRKTVHYKTARYVMDGKRTLEADLRRAVAAKRLARDRFQVIDQGGQRHYRLINNLESSDELTCGTMIAFTEGVHQSVLALVDDAEELDMELIAPKLEDASQRAEFVNGVLYFGVKRNHVVLLASQHLTQGRLEQHLLWLLKESARIIPKSESIILRDAVPPSLRSMNFHAVKALTLESSVQFSEDGQDAVPQATTATRTVTPGGTAWRLIRQAIEALGQTPPVIDVRGGIPPEEIAVTLSVRAIGGRRRRGSSSMAPTPVLDPVANALRNVDSDDVPLTIEFQDGRKVSVNDLKIRTAVSLECVEGVPIRASVYDQMRTWFKELLAQDAIDPA